MSTITKILLIGLLPAFTTFTGVVRTDTQKPATLPPVQIPVSDPKVTTEAQTTPQKATVTCNFPSIIFEQPIPTNCEEVVVCEGAPDCEAVVQDTVVERLYIPHDTIEHFYIAQYPSFPGGPAALMKFIAKNLTFPPMARDACCSGKVVVRFLINKEGEATGFTILRKLGCGWDEAVVDMLKKMPDWIPGRVGNDLKCVWLTMPFRCCLDCYGPVATPQNNSIATTTAPAPKSDTLPIFAAPRKTSELRIWPNPTTGPINVSFQGDSKPLHLSVIDVTGRILYQESMADFDGYLTRAMNVTGSVWVRAEQGDKVVVKQVIGHF